MVRIEFTIEPFDLAGRPERPELDLRSELLGGGDRRLDVRPGVSLDERFDREFDAHHRARLGVTTGEVVPGGMDWGVR